MEHLSFGGTLSIDREKERLLQDDERDALKHPPAAAWIVAEEYRPRGSTGGEALHFRWAVFATRERALRSLSSTRVETSFTPQFMVSGEETTYLPNGSDEGLHPLVIDRTWHGVRENEVEVGQEFRLFHNLWRDPRSGSYLKFNDAGNPEEVVRVLNDAGAKRVEVRRREVLEFMAASQRHLIEGVDLREHTSRSLQAVGLTPTTEDGTGATFAYHYSLVDREGSHEDSFSRLLGSRITEPPPVEMSGVWPFENEDDPTTEFIVDLDQSGRPVKKSCLTDGGAEYLTPVWFRREVLKRYYDLPDVYEVRDGYLACGGLWGIQIDNDHPRHVMAFLGDLGRDLPEDEHGHWVAHNIAPDARRASETAISRSFLSQFADAQSPEFAFKREFVELNAAWEEAHGFKLFKDLGPEDAFLLRTLRVPVNDSDPEYEANVKALAKILVESINDAGIKKAHPATAGERGINKLQQMLQELGAHEEDVDAEVTRPLRALHALNNGVRHRKGTDWTKAHAYLGTTDMPRVEGFIVILDRMRAVLQALEGHA